MGGIDGWVANHGLRCVEDPGFLLHPEMPPGRDMLKRRRESPEPGSYGPAPLTPEKLGFGALTFFLRLRE